MTGIPLLDPTAPEQFRPAFVQNNKLLRDLTGGIAKPGEITGIDPTWIENGITAAQLSGIEYTAYTPTWTGTGSNPAIGNGTALGEYVELGEIIHGWFLITAGNTTTFGTGTYEFGLPADRASPPGNSNSFGVARVVDGGATGYVGFLGGAAVNAAVRIFLPSAATSGLEVSVSQTVPMTAANTDTWGGYFTYKQA